MQIIFWKATLPGKYLQLVLNPLCLLTTQGYDPSAQGYEGNGKFDNSKFKKHFC